MKDGCERPDAQARLLDGLILGTFAGWNETGLPLVLLLTGESIVARAAIQLDEVDAGSELVLALDSNDPRPIIIGRLRHPVPAAPRLDVTLDVAVDGERVDLTAEREIVLRCGKASITLTRSGKIVLRGTYILSRSSGPNKIRGGSIELN